MDDTRQADTSRTVLQVCHIQRLPQELLREIFVYYLRATVLVEPIVPAHPYRPRLPSPLLLGHICSAWRHVSHGTPELWTTLPIRIWRPNVDYVTIAKAWIRRAHPYLLCVSLGSSIGIISDRMMTAILQSGDRIQSFGLYIPSLYFQPLIDPAVGSMTSLETLCLSAEQPSIASHAFPNKSAVTNYYVHGRPSSPQSHSAGLPHFHVHYTTNAMVAIDIP